MVTQGKSGGHKSILKKVFLDLALSAAFFIFRLFNFFHQVTPAMAIKPGLIAVFAKLFGDVFLIYLIACIDEQPRKIRGDNQYYEQ